MSARRNNPFISSIQLDGQKENEKGNVNSTVSSSKANNIFKHFNKLPTIAL